jgi:hypothetical protein
LLLEKNIFSMCIEKEFETWNMCSQMLKMHLVHDDDEQKNVHFQDWKHNGAATLELDFTHVYGKWQPEYHWLQL